MKILDIGEVSISTGVPPSTLRYYDETGLISSIGRHGLRRQFSSDVLLQLALISMGKSAGFSLDEIGKMFSSTGKPDLPRAELHQKADELDAQIKKLSALRDTLRHVADCPAPSHMECESFRRLVKLAMRVKGQRSTKRTVKKRG
jgi:DNA-binding transcriptional MerR regulator